MTRKQALALIAVADAITAAARAAGPTGAPAGVLYAAMMDKMSLDQFEQIMSALVRLGKVRKDGDCYVAL